MSSKRRVSRRFVVQSMVGIGAASLLAACAPAAPAAPTQAPAITDTDSDRAVQGVAGISNDTPNPGDPLWTPQTVARQTAATQHPLDGDLLDAVFS